MFEWLETPASTAALGVLALEDAGFAVSRGEGTYFLLADPRGLGIEDGAVRTAVSRLVGAGRLVGERIGRRSFYRLSDPAQAEFAAAQAAQKLPCELFE